MDQAVKAFKRSLPLVGAVLVALTAASCAAAPSGHPHKRPTPRVSLPPGFARGPAVSTTTLGVATLRHIDVKSLHRAPLPVSLARTLTQVIVAQPLTTEVRPLLVSDVRLSGGEKVNVVAARLPNSPAHYALFVLEGPGYRGQRLVQAVDGVAAGIVTLPKTMKKGTWAIGVEDLSQVTAGTGDSVQGDILLDLGIFKVS